MTADLCLGLDTSNYTTSAAIFDGHRDCGQNSGKPLTVPEGTKGSGKMRRFSACKEFAPGAVKSGA